MRDGLVEGYAADDSSTLMRETRWVRHGGADPMQARAPRCGSVDRTTPSNRDRYPRVGL
jgi:hypothetical protein